jgi:hypothetical protein
MGEGCMEKFTKMDKKNSVSERYGENVGKTVDLHREIEDGRGTRDPISRGKVDKLH